jgi:hypothetical protein
MNTTRTPEELRAEAVQCGKRASRYLAFGSNYAARRELNRARELTLKALEIEQAAGPRPQSGE